MNIELDLDQFRHVYVQEADEALSAMEEALITLEEQPDNAELLNEVFRFAHTIKGGAAMVEFSGLAEFSHKVEDALSLIRDGVVALSPARVTVLLQIVDAMREMLRIEAAGRKVTVRTSNLALVAQLMPADLDLAARPHDAAPVEDVEAWVPGTALSSRLRSLRVDMSKLDVLLNLSGEIAVAKGRLMQVLADRRDEAADSAAEEMERLLASLHERVMQLRLVSLGPIFRQHLRTVRDIAAQQGKLLKLELEGEDVEVDASIVEQLRDPLTHLVRNAVDHGMEYPAARRDAGKSPCGTIVIRARHDRGLVVVEVSDDGRGMDRDAILAKARERGMVEDGSAMTDAQVFALTMQAGFSTAAQVTEVSGRGVGMDVVRRNVESIRGSIEISSQQGRGSTVCLRVPLTIAIVEGFVVGVRGERFVVPVDSIVECLSLPLAETETPFGVLELRGAPLPYVRLRHLLDVAPGNAPAARESVVVVHYGGRQAGLVVDHLFGQTQAVLKPLPPMLARAAGVSGSTIMGDGQVSLMLDVGALLELCHLPIASTHAHTQLPVSS
ncbi:MAG: CheA signal transduction histidine kinase [Gemmatimonadetes bacterium]|nr:CheA signal transduction histidine kinase [Gemmatimonadota bacterium]